jgi:hypothetical protein
MRTWRVILAAALVTSGIAACAVGPDSGPGSGPATVATPTPVSPPSGAARVTQANADGNGFGLLRDVRMADQGASDRIVFEFVAAVPAYSISYVDLPVTSDPVGEVVPLAGSAALQISLIGGSAYAQFGDTEPTYRGPNRLPRGDTTQVTEIVNLGDWEGVMVWAAGVGSRTGFRVTTLDGPPRLVVDVDQK